MNRPLVFIAILAVFCASASAAPPKNICEDSQKFNYDGKRVNSVYILEKQFSFKTIQNLRINKAYDFDTWFCPVINNTMSQEDVQLYNQHIIKIYSESFFNGNVNDFYLHRNYIKNIRDSFIESKRSAEDPVNIKDCRNYLQDLEDIIVRVSEGYRFIDSFTTIKESKLSQYAFPISDLQNEIDSLPAAQFGNIIFSFKNKILELYYQQPLLLQSRFELNKESTKYLSLDTYGTIYVKLYIPLHNPNYDPNLNCLHLKDLPDFYQSI